MFIEQPDRWLRWLTPNAVWRMDQNEKAVYLTFDDGPIPQATPFILDTLERFGIKATFFMVGDNVRKYPELFERIVKSEHQIGNHTFNHWSGYKHDLYQYTANIEKANELIHSHLFRPPYGWMTAEQQLWVAKHNFKIVMWDLVTRDYSKRVVAADILQNIKKYSRNGSIITFHDSKRSIEKLRAVLPECLEWLQSQGYEFKTID